MITVHNAIQHSTEKIMYMNSLSILPSLESYRFCRIGEGVIHSTESISIWRRTGGNEVLTSGLTVQQMMM